MRSIRPMREARVLLSGSQPNPSQSLSCAIHTPLNISLKLSSAPSGHHEGLWACSPIVEVTQHDERCATYLGASPVQSSSSISGCDTRGSLASIPVSRPLSASSWGFRKKLLLPLSSSAWAMIGWSGEEWWAILVAPASTCAFDQLRSRNMKSSSVRSPGWCEVAYMLTFPVISRQSVELVLARTFWCPSSDVLYGGKRVISAPVLALLFGRPQTMSASPA